MKVLLVLLVSSAAATPPPAPPLAPPPARTISWWWDAPASADDPRVDGLLAWSRAHADIVTTVIARCGIVTCVRNTSTPRGQCENNDGRGGTIAGAMSPACIRVIPALAAFGIRTELWLGEDDSYSSAQYMFDHPNETALALRKITQDYPSILGFNFDLETREGGNASAVDRFGTFIGAITQYLNPPPPPPSPHGAAATVTNGAVRLRVSADVACLPKGFGRPHLTSNCKMLIDSSKNVNRLMNMRTYNAISYEEWVYTLLAPSLYDVHRHDVIGVGLGCWSDHTNKGNWSTTAASAEQRVCFLMNQSHLFAPELDMFRIEQSTAAVAPVNNFPEPFWIKPLQQWMSGRGCTNAIIPPKPSCPVPTVGSPNSTWLPGGNEQHCCVSFSYRGRNQSCDAACAKKECLAASMEWKFVDLSSHPYTCCHRSDRQSQKVIISS